MSDWKPKRFWKQASTVEAEHGFTVHLDDRPIRTPHKAALIVPTRAMADAIAAEWDAQVDTVNPETMPATRSANSAIDKLSVQRDEVINLLADYGDSDLLCYRAPQPERLVALQSENWDPVLDWAADTLGVRLAVQTGVMHAPQDGYVLDRLRAEIAAFDNFALVGVHDLISLSGSLLLALAVTRDHLTPQDAWRLSRIDEDWQLALWGDDAEARATAAVKEAAFHDAHRFFVLSQNSTNAPRS